MDMGDRAIFKRQLRLFFRPVDDLERHPAPEHFGLQISRMPFPVRRFPNAKSGFSTFSI